MHEGSRAGGHIYGIFSTSFTWGAFALGYPTVARFVAGTTFPSLFYSICADGHTFRERVFCNLNLIGMTNTCCDFLTDKFCQLFFKTNSISYNVFSTLLRASTSLSIFNLLSPRLEQKSNQKKRLSQGNYSIITLHTIQVASRVLFTPGVQDKIDFCVKTIALPLVFALSVTSKKPTKLSYEPKIASRTVQKNQKGSSIARATSFSLFFYGMHLLFTGNQTMGNAVLTAALPGLTYALKDSAKYNEENFIKTLASGGLAGVAHEGLSQGIPLGKNALMKVAKEIFKPNVVQMLNQARQFRVTQIISKLFDQVIYRIGSTVIDGVLFNQQIKRKSIGSACLKGIGDVCAQVLIWSKVNLPDGIPIWSYNFGDKDWRKYKKLYFCSDDAKKISTFLQGCEVSFYNFYNTVVNDFFAESFGALMYKHPLNHLEKSMADFKIYLFTRVSLAIANTGPALENFKKSRGTQFKKVKKDYKEYKKFYTSDKKDALKKFGTIQAYNEQGDTLVGQLLDRPPIGIPLPSNTASHIPMSLLLENKF